MLRNISALLCRSSKHVQVHPTLVLWYDTWYLSPTSYMLLSFFPIRYDYLRLLKTIWHYWSWLSVYNDYMWWFVFCRTICTVNVGIMEMICFMTAAWMTNMYLDHYSALGDPLNDVFGITSEYWCTTNNGEGEWLSHRGDGVQLFFF